MIDAPQLAPDDPNRDLTVVNPDDPALNHVSVVGDTYTILVTGEQSAGRYGLIDMHIPPGGGPPPHRHDFEEMFHVLEGTIEVTFRGETTIAHVGETVNIPGNAPHTFRNAGDEPARLLCMVTPAGLEQMFTEGGEPVEGRTSPPPELDDATRGEHMARLGQLVQQYGMETLPPAA